MVHDSTPIVGSVVASLCAIHMALVTNNTIKLLRDVGRLIVIALIVPLFITYNEFILFSYVLKLFVFWWCHPQCIYVLIVDCWILLFIMDSTPSSFCF